MRVVWSLMAQEQLLQTTCYLEDRFGEKTKLKLLFDVDHVVSQLKSAPFLGKEEPFVKDAPVFYRSLFVNRINKIVYYVSNDIIEIVAFWDTRREPKALIKDLKDQEKFGEP